MIQIPTPIVSIMDKMQTSVCFRKLDAATVAVDVIDNATKQVFHTATADSDLAAVEKAVTESVHVAKPLTPAQAYAMSVGAKAAHAESAEKIKSLEDEVAALKAALVEKSTKKIKPPVDPANVANQ